MDRGLGQGLSSVNGRKVFRRHNCIIRINNIKIDFLILQSNNAHTFNNTTYNVIMHSHW